MTTRPTNKRSMKVTLGGKLYEIPATWKVSVAMCDADMDPLDIAVDLHNSQHFAQAGLTYKPRYPLNLGIIVRFYETVLQASGYEITRDEIGEAVLEDGAAEHMETLPEFISLVVENGPEEESASPKGKSRKPVKRAG